MGSNPQVYSGSVDSKTKIKGVSVQWILYAKKIAIKMAQLPMIMFEHLFSETGKLCSNSVVNNTVNVVCYSLIC